MNIILASQSAQRKILMETFGLPFKVIPADIDEKAIPFTTPEEKAEAIARAKAKTVASTNTQSVIIAADSIVLVGQRILEKPESSEEAEEMLSLLSGSKAVELSGFCCIDQVRGTEYATVVSTTFQFRELSVQEIKHYCQTQPVMTWSGGFSPAYPAGIALVARVHGSLTSFTHGFPVEEVAKVLEPYRA